ncbi:sporulation integral membrane protein YtvI [Oceanobacillus sp. J11TS1]|uniref:sporulation integral membrane protein YtvI n=1 Tax=Oceanobacillus sp. J11TS1 TaxID=2807191 RepID=UPI001B1407CA|nr:sporulation integral membrane protein YtvI [Oceanobacillus sp. J11TS1]GIO22392.1 sporulation integral membrane protein YtvI [Oceanobacillus sp. J11TS1]
MQSKIIGQFTRTLVIIVILISSIFVCYILFPYIYPILIAFFLSFLFQPFINWFVDKLKMPRLLALITTFIIFISLFILSLFFLVSEVYQGILYLSDRLPSYFHHTMEQFQLFLDSRILPLYEQLLSVLNTLQVDYRFEVSEYIDSFTASITTALTHFFQLLLQQTANFLIVLPNSFAVFIFIVLATFMISYDFDNIQRKFHKVLPSNWYAHYKNIKTQLSKAVIGYFRAQFILVCISAVILCAGLLILQVEHAFTIVLFAAIADFIPYLGIGIIVLPWILFSFFSFNYPLTIGLSILYALIIIIRQLIEPKIVATSIGISPLIMLIGMFLGIQWFGILGFIISPIILVVILAINKSGVFQQLWLYIKG